ncbi:hypothetical protein ATCC90586_005705 [Pythium insidiosum]|nr:hypothetical protein ATCC90586_005705 [Pythium insidiosum]
MDARRQSHPQQLHRPQGRRFGQQQQQQQQHRHGFGGGRSGGRGHGHGHGHGHGNGHGANGASSRGSFWFKGEGYNDYETISIDEEVVGIRGYLNPERRGFPGLVKQRYSDFVVHEVAATGEPVVLTSVVKKKRGTQATLYDLITAFVLGASEPQPQQQQQQPPPAGAVTAPDDATVEVIRAIRGLTRALSHRDTAQKRLAQDALVSYNRQRLRELLAAELGKKMGAELRAFLDKVEQQFAAEQNGTAPSASDEDLVFYIGGLNEKRDRVWIHETIRRHGKGFVVADTITSADQSQVIRIRRVTTGPSAKGERDPRREWPVDRPDYLQFVLYKRNRDVVSVINQLASTLKVSASLFSYADAKDKRGISTQLCTLYRVPMERVQQHLRPAAGRSLDDQSHLVGHLKYVSRKLSSGDCLGNQFSVVLRALPDEAALSPEELSACVADWTRHGFINFFGIPRFGNSATPNHVVGRALLRKDFKLAVLLLLRPQDGEASKIREAREHFRQHKDVAAALRMLPPFLVAERAVLEGLLQHGMEATELAFRKIPLHMRLAYTEAYQQYVWNQMASLRMAQHPRAAPIVGDLVLARDADAPRRVVALTSETVKEYGIEDVVLPLPGFDIEYPANDVGDAYRKLLAMDGVDMASWASVTQSTNHHPYDLAGSYRRVVERPTHVSFEVKRYADATQPLLLTDVDRMLGRRTLEDVPLERRPASAGAAEDASSSGSSTTSAGRALILSFRLGFGADATMAIRELLKQSSSIHVQWQLSEQRESAAADATSSPTSVAGARARPAASVAGKKRSSGAAALSSTAGKAKDAKIIAQKKTQVAIGRPGFSLGKW